MTPDMAMAAAALQGEKDVHALVILAGEDAWLNLSKWALNWMRGGGHGARSRPKGTQTDLGTESTQPSTAQLEAIALPQNEIF